MSQEPPVKIKTEAPVKRTLAYQQAITQPREEPKEEKPDIPDFETVTTEEQPPQGAPGAAQPQAGSPQDMAALPGQGVPPQQGAVPQAQGQSEPLPWATDQREQWSDERNQDAAYGRPPPPGQPYEQQDPNAPPPPGDPYGQQQDAYAPPPGDPYDPQNNLYPPRQDPYGGQADPYGGQPAPYGQPQQGQWGGQPGEEWVQVVGSGSGMRATADIDAPILFAFPYGRQLKVVSRNADWVEVTDPNSSAKGWMPAHALAPSQGPNAPGYGQQAFEEPPQERRGFFQRGGFGGMINRAFGGGN